MSSKVPSEVYHVAAPKDNSTDQLKVTNSTELPLQVINGVKKMVMFVGNGRSGSSITGSLMDAHPHVIIPHQCGIFKNLPKLTKASSLNNKSLKENLFNTLYAQSKDDAIHFRKHNKKGYTLGVEGLWQGKYDTYIDVIGDKHGDPINSIFTHNKKKFVQIFLRLQETLKVPILLIQNIRNPFDMIATYAIESHKGAKQLADYKKSENENKYNNTASIKGLVDVVFQRFSAALELTEMLGKENVLAVHNCDLVNDPRGTMSRIFDFLEVDTTEHYLDVCAEKVFKSESRSRNAVAWTREQREMVERRMKEYEILNRYNFTSK